MSRNLGFCTLLTFVATGAAPVGQAASSQQQHPTDTQVRATTAGPAKMLKPLAVVGFHADAKLDARDAWLPTAVEETLAWRLRRVPALTVLPTIRTQQARRELAESDNDPPTEWSRVVRLLGAKHWLKGVCAGTPDALTLDLELVSVEAPEVKPARMRLGPGRLFDVIDEATRWTLSRLDVARISKATEDLISAPPAASPSALEYYAKAISAARAGKLRDGVYYLGQALDYDRTFCPALLLLAKIELRGAAGTRVRAAVHLRGVKQLAADRGDVVSEAEFELNQGLLMMMTRSFEPARQRFESALAIAFERDDPYGQLAAMNSLCEFWCNCEPPAQAELPADALQRFRLQNLRRAAEWQVLVLEMVHQLGDVVAEAPAANKLAIIHEQLGEWELALQAHQQTITAAQKTGSRRTEATGWMFLGQWYRRQERWQEALEATSRCLALVVEQARPAVRVALADIYRSMSLPQDALGQYELAYEALADGDDLMSQFRCLRGIAELKRELGERTTAIKRLQEALDIAHALELADEETLQKQLEQWQRERP